MLIKNPESNELLKEYIYILLEWQSKINLISKYTIKDIWERHVKDSLQLKEFIDSTNNKYIIDIGSGAGFPGMVLGISDRYNHYTLIDSNSKKTSFLNYVKTTLKLKNITIINDRIENLFGKLYCDYLISRGLTNMENLLLYSREFLSSNSLGIFLKGKNYNKELANFKNKNLFNIFDIEKFNNKINNNGKIILVKKKI